MRMYSLIKHPVGLIFENSHLRPVILPKRQYLHQYYPSSYVILHDDGTQFVWLNRKVVDVIHGKVYRGLRVSVLATGGRRARQTSFALEP